jgi:hypothetical protein
MHRLINACVLPSLLLSALFAVMIFLSPNTDAQSGTNCLGQNRCEKWNNISGNVVTALCVALTCSKSTGVWSIIPIAGCSTLHTNTCRFY